MLYQKSRKGFTLIEVIVVIGILLIIAGMILPPLVNRRYQRRRIRCADTISSLVKAVQEYYNEHEQIVLAGVTGECEIKNTSYGLKELTKEDVSELPGWVEGHVKEAKEITGPFFELVEPLFVIVHLVRDNDGKVIGEILIDHKKYVNETLSYDFLNPPPKPMTEDELYD
ncbi:MAG: prepilin-type N-terminal cleavage/methylation domain-containing protein [Candidatus Aenigmarchaeota archaeon]|nr:prepilin-type N-terminal cleavage/methylation domain-containing protein [Candidatus Aenigmarchaeota archaeon]